MAAVVCRSHVAAQLLGGLDNFWPVLPVNLKVTRDKGRRAMDVRGIVAVAAGIADLVQHLLQHTFGMCRVKRRKQLGAAPEIGPLGQFKRLLHLLGSDAGLFHDFILSSGVRPESGKSWRASRQRT